MRLLTFLVLAGVTHAGAFAQADAGTDQYICGNTTTLDANVPGPGESGFWDAGTTGATFVDASDPQTVVSGLPSGVNELIWVHIAPTGATSDVVSIWAYDPAMPEADAGPDQLVPDPPGYTTMAGSAPTPPAVCDWTIVAGTGTIGDATDPNSMIWNLGSAGTNVFVWSCDNGPCGVYTDQVVLQPTTGTGLSTLPSGLRSMLIFDAHGQQLHVLNAANVEALTILDAQGRLVAHPAVHGSAGAWSMAGHPPGIYVARAVVDGRSHILRFTVPQ